MQENTRLDKLGRRSINRAIWLRIPKDRIEIKCREFMKKNKTKTRTEITTESDFHIISKYQTEYRGLVQYYKLAHNLNDLNKLKWAMERSLTGTLANKYRTTRAKIREKYETKIKHRNGKTYIILETRIKRKGKKDLIAQWGGIPLNREPKATINDSSQTIWTTRGGELIQRLLANKCEICNSEDNIEIHHIKALKNIQKKGRKKKPNWQILMIARKRKTLATCKECHDKIHKGDNPHK